MLIIQVWIYALYIFSHNSINFYGLNYACGHSTAYVSTSCGLADLLCTGDATMTKTDRKHWPRRASVVKGGDR